MNILLSFLFIVLLSNKIFQADLLKVENEKEMDGVYAYKVQCLGLGETSITLRFDSLKVFSSEYTL